MSARERTAEAEKEIERQRLLELERAKTRELRHNLDMEKERQTQVRLFPLLYTIIMDFQNLGFSLLFIVYIEL